MFLGVGFTFLLRLRRDDLGWDMAVDLLLGISLFTTGTVILLAEVVILYHGSTY